MKYIIDTSTWVSLVRYYKPFDNSSIIYDFFKQKIENDDFLLLNEVSLECSFVSKSLVTKELDFVLYKTLITKTSDLLPSKKFYNLLENQFCNSFAKRQLEDYEIEQLTEDFVKSADAKIVMKALAAKSIDNNITIVTEETTSNNDNKLFKKIPIMCSLINVDCINLPQLIIKFDNEISIRINNN